jgi:hypothetical protein
MYDLQRPEHPSVLVVCDSRGQFCWLVLGQTGATSASGLGYGKPDQALRCARNGSDKIGHASCPAVQKTWKFHMIAKNTMSFLKQTLAEFSKNRCSTLAAALAYYTAFALPPLLYLLLTVLTLGLSVAYDSDRAQKKAENILQSQASQMMGNPSASEEIATILKNNKQADGKWWKTLLSFAGIVIGATGVVAALQAALNQVWEVKQTPAAQASWTCSANDCFRLV